MRNTPEFQKLIFQLNNESGYYQIISAPFGFTKIPGELKLEKSIREDYQKRGATFIVRSRQENGKRKFQTGIIETGVSGLYFGDHFHPQEQVRNSFCLFYFSASQQELTIFYFNHYKVYPKQRAALVAMIAINETGK